MPEAETLRVKGYREFLRATDRAGSDAKRFTREAFREIGDQVRAEAQRLFQKTDERSATGYRVAVRLRGVAVEQSIRKTTGKHPEYGALQMRKALLPALRTKETEVASATERALDKVADHFDQL